MLVLTLVLFALAAVLGAVTAFALFKKRPTSKPVVLAHGAIAATGLVLLIVHVISQPAKLLIVAACLLVVAALGGLILVNNDARGRPGPLPLVAIHAAAAVTAVVLVALVALR